MSTITNTLQTPATGWLERLNTQTLLRIHVGAFFLPQVYYKIDGFAGAVKFFDMAGFHPAVAWVVLDSVLETLFALALIFNVYAKYAAFLAVGLLIAAGGAVIAVRGPGWLFNRGGVEYHVFWALCCFYVFVNEWRRNPGWLPLRR